MYVWVQWCGCPDVGLQLVGVDALPMAGRCVCACLQMYMCTYTCRYVCNLVDDKWSVTEWLAVAGDW